MALSKEQFLAHMAAMYSCGNRSDSDDRPSEENWTKPAMSGVACCALLDKMMAELCRAGVLTGDEMQAFYDEVI